MWLGLGWFGFVFLGLFFKGWFGLDFIYFFKGWCGLDWVGLVLFFCGFFLRVGLAWIVVIFF